MRLRPASRSRRSPALAVVLLALLLTGATAGPVGAAERTPRSIGSDAVGAGEAPFAALLLLASGSYCGAAVLAPDTILTAAHCVVAADGSPLPAAAMTVAAGGSSRRDPAAQRVPVAGVRVHPGFVDQADVTTPDDVAVVRLAQALVPGPAVRPIGLGEVPDGEQPVVQYGFGAQGATDDGALRRLRLVTQPASDCGAANAVVTCYRSPTGSTCPGDSGSPVVSEGPAGPVLVAVHSGGSCEAGRSSRGARLSAPELSAFVAGDDTPPVAPRGGTTTFAAHQRIVGQTMTCSAPGFTGDAPLVVGAVFLDQDTGAVVQEGDSPARVFADADAGRRISCAVRVRNAGGLYRGPVLRTTQPIRPLLPAGLTIRRDGRAYAVARATDAPSVVLTVTDAGGRVVRTTSATARAIRFGRPTLRTGRYAVCASSPQTLLYAAGRACLTETVAGRVGALLSTPRTTRRGSRFVVRLTADRRLVGRRVRVEQTVSRPGARTRRHASRVRLAARTRITTRAVARGGRSTLRIVVPTVTLDGVRYAGTTLRVALRR